MTGPGARRGAVFSKPRPHVKPAIAFAGRIPHSRRVNDPELTLLGHSENRLPARPEEARLETFANCRPGRRYTIALDCPEFSSLCPVTGQPDSCHLRICYIPDQRCVETKSLKFYLASYRNLPAFNEEIVNRILDDLAGALDPLELTVRGEFGARGGIQLSCEANHQKP